MTDQKDARRLVLSVYSEVADGWSRELQLAWDTVREQPTRTLITVDLTNVKAIDLGGESMIRRLASEGVRFRVNGSAITSRVIDIVCEENIRARRNGRGFCSMVFANDSMTAFS